MFTTLINKVKNHFNGEITNVIQVDDGIRHIPVTKPEIKIVDVLENEPSFRKCYSGTLSNNARIELEAQKGFSWKPRIWSGILAQPNGNRIYFDPSNIAEKIIDPQLVPLIQNFVQAAFELDQQFMESPRDTFVDKNNHVWKRIG